MAEAPGDGDAPDPRNAGDPLSELAAVLANACALGSTMLGSLAGQADIARAAAAFAPFVDPFRRTDGMGDAEARAPSDGVMAQEMADMAGFLAQTWMVAASSGFRYWRRLAETYGQHQSGLMRALGTGTGVLSDDERRTMVDELRGYVRELGDVSLQEARLLQQELERLSFGLAASAAPAPGDAEQRRRWRAKP